MKNKIFTFLSDRLDNICSIFKWSIIPILLIPVIIIKYIKQIIFKDLKTFKSFIICSPIGYYDEWYIDKDFFKSIKHLFKMFYRSPNDYLFNIIPISFSDKPELIKDILFTSIIDYVEKEKCFEHIDYSVSDYHKKLAINIKKIYKYVKASEQQRYDAANLLFKINPKYMFKCLNINDIHLKTSNIELYKVIIESIPEDYINCYMDDIVLKKIIEIRQNLWV